MDKVRLLNLLKNLLRIDSVNPSLSPGGAGEGGLSSFLGRYMNSMGLRVEFQAVARGRKNVVGILKGSGGGRSLILNGHMDTVGIGNMTIPPFSPKVSGGRLYGRGAYDMKAGLAAQLSAVHSLLTKGIRLQGDLLLSFVCDEEYASAGTERFLEKYGADAALITESTEEKLLVAHKGFAWVRFEVLGRAAHGSDSARGIDAIAGAARLVASVSDAFPGARRHPLLGRSTCHASAISGGLGWSTYPDRATADMEFRVLPGDKADDILRQSRNLIASLRLRASAKLVLFRPGYEVARENSVVASLRRAYKKTTGTLPAFAGGAGWMDSALFGKADIPTVLFGPHGAGAHAAVEWVNLASVTRTARVLKNFIWDYCNE